MSSAQRNDAADFLGRGWAWPIALDDDAQLATVAYEDDVREAIRIILSTAHGERVMRPDFGSNLSRLVFEPVTTETLALAKHYVEEALERWEARIDQVRVSVEWKPTRGELSIEVRYRIRATNTFHNFVYPYYLVEGEAP